MAASQFNCLDQLNTYANFLSANPNTGSPRPQPLLWTDTDCSGNSLFSQSQVFQNGSLFRNDYGSNFNSIYIPVGWTVTLYYAGDYGSYSITYPLPNTSSNIPVLISDFSNLLYPNSNQTIKNTVTAISFVNPQTIPTWQLQMCNNEISTVVGARHLTSYQSGSVECDAFMTGYCSSPPCQVSTLGCAKNSLEPAPLPDACKYCVCLVEENCLRETFCTPGSTDPNCVSDFFSSFIPVTCLGRNCSIEGYRWNRMQNQRCNITLCQQIIRLVGNEIVIKGGSSLYCGNFSIPLTSVTPSTPPEPPGPSFSLPTYAWILIGIGVFILCVIVPLAVILYKRSYATKSKKDPTLIPHSFTKQPVLNFQIKDTV